MKLKIDCSNGFKKIDNTIGNQISHFDKSKNEFIHIIDPKPRLFIIGAVHIAQALVSLAEVADYEMILRLLYKNRLKVAYIPEVMVKMRLGGESNKSFLNRLRANKEESLAWKQNKLNKPIFIRFTKPLQKLKQFFLKP